jgi:hypothetical protein
VVTYKFFTADLTTLAAGGSGTTTAGLRYGLPTFVCPFFGDQFMWGAMVHRAGVGPEHCPVNKLTAEMLAEKLKALKEEAIRKKAVELSITMNNEAGVQGGLKHFLDSLPRDNMLCDVSLLLGETHLASYRIQSSDLKISLEVAAILRDKPLRQPTTGADFLANLLIFLNLVLNWFNPAHDTRYTRHAICTYALGRIQTFSQGMAAGWFGLATEFFRGLFEIYVISDRFARSYGTFGCLFGVMVTPFYILYDFLRGCVVFVDRIMVGVSNGCFGTDRLFIIDPMVRAHVYQTTANLNDLLNYDPPHEARRGQLKRAVRLANYARQLYLFCKPTFPKGHWHWLEVELKQLKAVVIRQGRDRLGLMDEEYDILMDCLDHCTVEGVSFSRFCLFLGEAIKNRPKPTRRALLRCTAAAYPVMSAPSPFGDAMIPVGDIDDDGEELKALISSWKFRRARARARSATV